MWLGCPHCYEMEPLMMKYKKNHPDYVEFKQVPATLNPRWAADAKTYYIAEILDPKGEKNLIMQIFQGMHEQKRRLNKRAAIVKSDNVMELFKSSSQHYFSHELKALLKEPTVEAESSFDDVFLLDAVKSELDKVLAVDYRTYMCDNILTKVDRATMSVSLEGREPLLDHNIVEFMAQVNSNIKYKNKNKKHILKEITHRYLPKELMDRPKKGFSVPLFDWFQDELKEYILYYINQERLDREGIFHTEAVLQKRDLYFQGKLQDINELWYILVFEMWYERWMM